MSPAEQFAHDLIEKVEISFYKSLATSGSRKFSNDQLANLWTNLEPFQDEPWDEDDHVFWGKLAFGSVVMEIFRRHQSGRW